MGSLMKILVTGAKGFVGKNLVLELKNNGNETVFEYDLDTKPELLEVYCRECDFVYHLAGVNRPKKTEEFMEGNFGFTSMLLETLKKHNNNCPIMLSSSIQASEDNPYGKSKLAGEQLLINYGKETGASVYIYRFPNLFGKWCRPNYNSVVATFCHRIATGESIEIHDPTSRVTLVYIDDVLKELLSVLEEKKGQSADNYYFVPETHETTVGELAALIKSFKESRVSRQIVDMTEGSLSKKLYSTYLSYLPKDEFKYSLEMHEDIRGSFTELLRTPERGQMSVNISKPGIEKGNHWHHSKNEKFIVVSGNALIQFRKPGEDEVISYHVSGETIEAVDIPVGYTHNIINEGDTDLVTLMWCNECFDSSKPDTNPLLVNEK